MNFAGTIFGNCELSRHLKTKETAMPIILWLLGVPLGLVIVLWLLHVV